MDRDEGGKHLLVYIPVPGLPFVSHVDVPLLQAKGCVSPADSLTLV